MNIFDWSKYFSSSKIKNIFVFKEDEEDVLNDDKVDNKEYPQLSLSESMGMGDIAERLRTHFLANLPTQSYNWLTNGNNSLLEKVKREKHPSGGIK